MRRMIDQAPRIIGVFAGIIAAEYWYDASHNGGNEPIMAIIIALPVCGLAWIRDLYNRGQRIPQWLKNVFEHRWFKPAEGVTPWHKSSKSYTSWRDLPPFTLCVVICSIVLFIQAAVIASLASFWGVPTAMELGTLAVAFSAFALLVAAGSMLTFLSYSWRYPIDMTLVILAIGLGWFSWTWTDNHGVRMLGAEQLTMQPSDRPTLEKAFENWRTAVGSGTPEQTLPFVIVATAGGWGRDGKR